MRVISGTAKGRRLKSVPGESTRPVTDRVKEAVFSILSGAVEGSEFLDLFAGTGGVGVEALSRGARRATFVEKSPRAVAVIRENLELTGLSEKAVVVRADVFRFLERAAGTYDIVYVAPPQYQGLWQRTLKALDAPAAVARDLVVVQIHPREFSQLDLAHFSLEDQRRYGSTMVCFYCRQSPGLDEAGCREEARW